MLGPCLLLFSWKSVFWKHLTFWNLYYHSFRVIFATNPMAVLSITRIHLKTFSFSKILITVLSRVLLSLATGIPVNSRHSYVEYWLLLQHWHYKLVTLSLNTELTCLVTERSEPSFSKSFFKSDSSFLIPAHVESNLPW